MFGLSCCFPPRFPVFLDRKTTLQTLNLHATPRHSKTFNSIKIKYSSLILKPVYIVFQCITLPKYLPKHACRTTLTDKFTPLSRGWGGRYQYHERYWLCMQQLGIFTQTKLDFNLMQDFRWAKDWIPDHGWRKNTEVLVTIFTFFWVLRSHILTRSSHVLLHSGPL